MNCPASYVDAAATPAPPRVTEQIAFDTVTADELSVIPLSTVWLHGAPSAAVASSISTAADVLTLRLAPPEGLLRPSVNWRAACGAAVLRIATEIVLAAASPSAHVSVPLVAT